jgi:hypothetical protein
MTVQQLHLFSALGLALFIAVAVLPRATRRRVAGALAGAAASGATSLGVIALGEEVGWWHMAIAWEPYFLTALLLVGVTQGGLVFLLTWRVARRFGRVTALHRPEHCRNRTPGNWCTPGAPDTPRGPKNPNNQA